MNIFEFAMQMEKDGESYYRDLARESNTRGLQKIFVMLADEEVKHFKVIQSMQLKQPATRLAESTILDNTKNIFQEMKDLKQPLHIDSNVETEKYRFARDIEEKSRDFYQKSADETDIESQREIFLKLAGEEEKHLRIMENIVDFVSRPEPGQWLENAEWSHLSSY
jgi:rubrerythrin